MTKHTVFFILILLLHPISTFGQGDADVDYLTNNQLWTDYNLSYIYNNNTKLYGDIGYRNISTGSWNRYILRGGYKINPDILQMLNPKGFVELHLGIGTFFTDNTNSDNNIEIRPYQGLKTKWPVFTYTEFTHYLRLEERIEHIVGENHWQVKARLRYKLRNTIKFKGQLLSIFYIPVCAEFFVNLPKGIQFNDVVRLTAGIGTRPKYNYGFEFNASWHTSKDQITGVSNTDDFVLRLRFLHYLRQ